MKMALWLSIGLLLAEVALASQVIDETREVNADVLITINNVKGKVVIRTGVANRVRITGALGQGVQELSIEGGGDRLDIEVRQPRNARQVEATMLELLVPEGASVEVETVSAQVRVSGLRGESIAIETVSGKVEIEAQPGRLEITTVSGDIGIDSGAERTELSSVSGDIDVVGATGELRVATVSGKLSIRAKALSRAHFESVSGDMKIDASLASQAKLSISSHSGDIELLLPETLSARCEIETFSGAIRSDRGSVNQDQYGPQKSLSFLAGEGSGRIEIESFSGDVRIRSGVR